MFYLLQKNLRFQIFVLVALAALFCYQLFALPVAVCPTDSFLPLSQSLGQWIMQNPLAAKTGIMFLFALQQVMLFLYYKRSKFDEQTSLLPCAALTVFAIAGGPTALFSPVLIANFVLTSILLFSDDSDHRNQKGRVLLSGILIGIATFFDTALFLIAVAFLFMLLNSRFNTISDLFVTLIGMAIPYIYCFACFFFVDDFPRLLDSITRVHFDFPLFTGTHPSVVSLISAVVAAIILIYVLVKLKIRFDYKLIVVRKRFANTHILFATLIGVLLMTNLPFPESVSYLSVPLAIYLAAYAPSRRLTITKEVVFTVLLTAIILLGMGV